MTVNDMLKKWQECKSLISRIGWAKKILKSSLLGIQPNWNEKTKRDFMVWCSIYNI